MLREDKIMESKYTAIVRKSKFEYVAVCLELNVTARGDDLAEVEKKPADGNRVISGRI